MSAPTGFEAQLDAITAAVSGITAGGALAAAAAVRQQAPGGSHGAPSGGEFHMDRPTLESSYQQLHAQYEALDALRSHVEEAGAHFTPAEASPYLDKCKEASARAQKVFTSTLTARIVIVQNEITRVLEGMHASWQTMGATDAENAGRLRQAGASAGSIRGRDSSGPPA